MPAFTSRHALALLALTVCQLLTRVSFAGKGAVYSLGVVVNQTLTFLSVALSYLPGLAGIVIATAVGVSLGQRFYSAQVSSQGQDSTHV
ncbi:MAG: hypothetical protein AAF657_00150 [Acidobacteriota bacterium]